MVDGACCCSGVFNTSIIALRACVTCNKIMRGCVINPPAPAPVAKKIDRVTATLHDYHSPHYETLTPSSEHDDGSK